MNADNAPSQNRPRLHPSALAEALAGGALGRAMVAAVVVGTILNVINQGEALIGHANLDWLKLALTYTVPFFVSLHGAVSASAQTRRDNH